MEIKQIVLSDEDSNHFTHRFELDDYYIEVFKTVFGGRRIAIREKDSPFYLCNWCAGKEIIDAQKLIGLAVSVIQQDFPKIKFCSDPKPYFNDLDFVKRMEEIGYNSFIFDTEV